MSEPFSLEEAKKLVAERIVVDANEVSDTVQKVVSACAAIVAEQVEKTLRQMGMTEGVAKKIQLLEREIDRIITSREAAKERIEALEAENKIATDALRVIANLRAGAVDSGDAWQPIEEAERALAAIAKAKGE